MKNREIIKNKSKKRRSIRVRAKISGTPLRPRLAVYKSLKHISVQAIDDSAGITLASASDIEVKAMCVKEASKLVGGLIAKKLIDKEISAAVFDKRHYKYHGLIKDLAEAAREGGLKF